ncbi:MAG TPA: T9SS type A sorting domain-containing protein [Paludibacter sp.]
MKKTILLSLFCVAFLALNAQTMVISNGEDTGINWWQAGSTGVEYVDWHPKEGNPSAKAMTIWISPNSDAWSGGGLSGLNINVSTYNKISVLVFKNVAGTVRLELQDGGPNQFVSANYTTPGVWQKLEFAIPAGMGNITTLLIAPFIDYNLSTIVGEQSRCFWDDVIAFSGSTGLSNATTTKEIVKTEIFTMTGKLLETLNQSQKVPYSSMLKGMYILKQTDVEGNIACSKISIK